jgi:hypothetical protein
LLSMPAIIRGLPTPQKVGISGRLHLITRFAAGVQ